MIRMNTIIGVLLYGIAAGFALFIMGVSVKQYASPVHGRRIKYVGCTLASCCYLLLLCYGYLLYTIG